MTRAADSAIVDATPWVAAGQGTMVFRGNVNDIGATGWSLRIGTSDRLELHREAGGEQRIRLVVDGSVVASATTANAAALGSDVAIAASWDASNLAITLNGGTVATGSHPGVGSPTLLYVGHRPVAGRINGEIGLLAYYPTAITGSDLQDLCNKFAA